MSAKGNKRAYAPPAPQGMTGDAAMEAQARAARGDTASLPGNVANSWLNMLPGQQKKSITGQ